MRAALLREVTPEDMAQIARALVEKAKDGDVTAAREVILRTLGRPVEQDLIDRLEEVEAKLAAAAEHQTP